MVFLDDVLETATSTSAILWQFSEETVAWKIWEASKYLILIILSSISCFSRISFNPRFTPEECSSTMSLEELPAVQVRLLQPVQTMS
jgi:hypothetical protein